MSTHPPRTIIVTGGIVSGIGKGITAASIGRLFINRGFRVSPVKIDPYLNTDAGTMNPFQHGEVFVTDDGHEADLDLGHYERFLNCNVSKLSNFTSGAVYQSVLEHERDGKYLGQTIQIIPHVTDEVVRRVYAAGEDADILTVELGGTVGDIEALPFIEAMRQYREKHQETTAIVHVVKMDYLYPSEEAKTKPIQHSVTTLRSYGLQPDMLIVRCKEPLEDSQKQKIALFTGVSIEAIIEAPNAKSLYDIPGLMEKAGAAVYLEKRLGLKKGKIIHRDWQNVVAKFANSKGEVRVGLVGKYTQLSDAYLSVIEAVEHAGIANGVKACVVAIDSEDPELLAKVQTVDAVIVPGGFGSRGIQGKLAAIRYVRENSIPFLGICLGLQLAVIEYAQTILGIKNATSLEFDESATSPVITFLPGQESIRQKGGTMRLGSYKAVIAKGSLVETLYKNFRPGEIQDGEINERHRHRYEVNPVFVEKLIAGGLQVSGRHGKLKLVEFIELPTKAHPYFVATQAHPEFRSRPESAHPLFAGLIAAAIKRTLR